MRKQSKNTSKMKVRKVHTNKKRTCSGGSKIFKRKNRCTSVPSASFYYPLTSITMYCHTIIYPCLQYNLLCHNPPPPTFYIVPTFDKNIWYQLLPLLSSRGMNSTPPLLLLFIIYILIWINFIIYDHKILVIIIVSGWVPLPFVSCSLPVTDFFCSPLHLWCCHWGLQSSSSVHSPYPINLLISLLFLLWIFMPSLSLSNAYQFISFWTPD